MRKSEEEDGETFESSAYSWDDLKETHESVDTLDDGTAHTDSLQTISTLKSSVSEDYYSDDNFESLANESTKVDLSIFKLSREVIAVG